MGALLCIAGPSTRGNTAPVLATTGTQSCARPPADAVTDDCVCSRATAVPCSTAPTLGVVAVGSVDEEVRHGRRDGRVVVAVRRRHVVVVEVVVILVVPHMPVPRHGAGVDEIVNALFFCFGLFEGAGEGWCGLDSSLSAANRGAGVGGDSWMSAAAVVRLRDKHSHWNRRFLRRRISQPTPLWCAVWGRGCVRSGLAATADRRRLIATESSCRHGRVPGPVRRPVARSSMRSCSPAATHTAICFGATQHPRSPPLSPSHLPFPVARRPDPRAPTRTPWSVLASCLCCRR